jgi:hypothetical protein
MQLFFPGVHMHGGPAPMRQYLLELIQLIRDRKIEPGKSSASPCRWSMLRGIQAMDALACAFGLWRRGRTDPA